MQSPGYRQADQDVGFLNQAETRGLRLQIDYQKAELLLKQYGILQWHEANGTPLLAHC